MTVTQKAVNIRIFGIPRPQGSKKHVGRGILVESSNGIKEWRHDVRDAVFSQYAGPLIDTPVAVCATFLFNRPKGHYGQGRNADRLKPSAPKHLTSTAHGDIDKILRGLLDAISAGAGGSLIKDDSLVVEVMANKRYVEDGELPGAYLTVTKLA